MKHLIFVFTLLISCPFLQAQKVVIIEEAVGTWCGWCPQGLTMAETLTTLYPGRILVSAIHINDTMETDDGYFDSTGLAGLPTSNIDRSLLDLDPIEWMDTIESQLALEIPATINVSRNYEADSRNLEITICADFMTSLSNVDYRLAGILIEDGVTGNPPYFNQDNFYSAGDLGPMGGFEDLPAIVNAEFMVYDHVNRGLISDFHGVENSIPANPTAGESYCTSLTTTLSDDFDPEYIKAYGLLIDHNTGSILNAGTSAYAEGDLNAVPMFHSPNQTKAQINVPIAYDILAHDPDKQALNFEVIGDLPSWLNLVAIGEDDAQLIGIPNGVGNFDVSIKVSDGIDDRTEIFTVEVVADTEGWVQIGDKVFSDLPSEHKCFSAINPNNNEIYTLGMSHDNEVFSYKFDGSEWSQMGSTMAGINLFGDIAVNPVNDEVWRIYRETNSSIVSKFNGTDWEQVGDYLPVTSYHSIGFTSDGKCYVSGYRSGAGVLVFLWDEGWIELMQPQAENNLLRCSMEIGPNDEIVLLASEFLNGPSFSRAYIYNGTWDPLGGLINQNLPTVDGSNSYHSLAIGQDGTVFTAIAHSGSLNIYAWEGSEWETIAQGIAGSELNVFDITTNDVGDLFVYYADGFCKANCEQWNGTSWTTLGIPSFTKTLLDISGFVYKEGNPGMLYTDNYESIGKLSAKRYEQVYSSIQKIVKKPESIKLFPNPAQNNIHVVLSKNNIGPYYIFNQNGQVVQSGNTIDEVIDIKVLPAGFYTLFMPGENTYGSFIKTDNH